MNKSKPLYILVGGLFAAGVLFAVSRLIDWPQCPDTYTQVQIDAERCVVGANIGVGLVMVVAISIAIGTVILAIHNYLLAQGGRATKPKPKHHTKAPH